MKKKEQIAEKIAKDEEKKANAGKKPDPAAELEAEDKKAKAAAAAALEVADKAAAAPPAKPALGEKPPADFIPPELMGPAPSLA